MTGSVRFHRPTPLATAVRWLLGLLVAVSAVACAGPGRGKPLQAPEAAARANDARSALESLAAAQALRPAPPPAAPDPPPGIDPASLAPASPDDAAARQPLEEVLRDPGVAPPLRSIGISEPSAPDAGALARRHGLQAFVSGRLALLRGELRRAIEDLQTATRLDPSSRQPWEAFGEALLRAGQVRAAVDAFDRAIERGSLDPLILLTVARDAQHRADHRRAISVLAALLRADSFLSDPALAYIVPAVLAESLRDTGRLAAAREALQVAVSLPTPFTAPTRYRDELADAYRRRGESWRAIGDLSCRLGDHQAALAAYAHAAELAPEDSYSILPRQVYASVAAGRPAAAALAILDAAGPGGARASSVHVRLARYLAAHDAHAAARLADALEGLLDAGTSTLPRSSAGHLARAAAAASAPSDPARAREVLLRSAARPPVDTGTCLDLLVLLRDEPDAAAAAWLRRLAEAAPTSSLTLADAVVRARRASVPALVHALESGSASPPGRILAAALSARAGDLASAARDLDRVLPPRVAAAPLLATRVDIAASIGLWSAAERDLAALGALSDSRPADHSIRVLHARALAEFQRFDAAWGRFAPFADAPNGDSTPTLSAADLLFGGNLAVSAGRFHEAESLFGRAIAADPYVEEPYLALIALHADSGRLADPAKLAEDVRALREAAPGGRGLRLLRAQELLRAGQADLVEDDLLDLAREDPRDAVPFQALIAAWDPRLLRPADTATIDRRIAVARAIADADPGAPWPLILLARLESRQDRDAALRRLDEAAAAAPPAEAGVLAAAAEDLLRLFDRSAEADRRAEARLLASPPTIVHTVALAAVLTRSGRPEEAASALANRLPAGAILDGPQSAALADALADLARRSPADALASARRLALATRHADPSLFRVWARFVAVAGRAADAAEFVRAAERAGVVEPVLAALVPEERRERTRPTPAELAYTLGGAFAGRGLEDQAEAMNELALSLDPDHAMACNDLGYTLLEAGRDLDRAERLLEHAHRALPDDPNVTDSIGWLRYKRGMLGDRTDEAGHAVAGAVSLLRRAVELQGDSGDGTIIDHYGDALWAAGEREEALRQWNAAARRAGEILARARQNGLVDSPGVRRIQSLIESIRAKQAAVARDDDPPIAPMLAGPPPGAQPASPRQP